MSARYSSINGWRNSWRNLPFKSLRHLVWFVGLAGVANCDDCDDCGGGGGGGGPHAPQSLVITSAPNVQQIAQGDSALHTITVQRTGFTGLVTLGVADKGIPAGVSVSFDVSTIPSGQTTAIATVGVASSAVVTFGVDGLPSNEFLPITATGGDGLRYAANIVYAPKLSSQAGVTIATTPPTIVMHAGETSDVTVAIARQGSYAGRMTISVTASHSGVSATLTPVAGIADTYRLRLIAALTGVVIATPLNFTITALPDGLPTSTTRVTVVVALPAFSPGVSHATRMRTNESDTVTVLLGRGAGFSAPIAFSIDSGRTGLTGTFAPNPAVDDASLLTIRAASDVPPGDYKVRVRGVSPAGSRCGREIHKGDCNR